MAIILKTKEPQIIVEEIKKRIDNESIDTWSYDDDGDFTHVGQWKNKAWLSPSVNFDELTFNIVGRKNVSMTLMEFSVFHGRFVEMLINQFPKQIIELKVTLPYQSEMDCDNFEIF